ncbi:MAG: hypothetical protein Q8O14_04980 [bacterium]|nr:hypothetical protein [bacterium]
MGRPRTGFRPDLAGQDEEGRQRLLARVSGSYRRGNERATARHPRNTW